MENGKLKFMSISTKKGDGGKTSLIASGHKKIVCKDCLEIAAIGSIDEVESFLGLAASFIRERKIVSFLEKIQADLFIVNSILAGARRDFTQEKVKWLERETETLEKRLPALTQFILPGGSRPAAFLHVARTVVRRAERELVVFSRQKRVEPSVLAYLNRLSDCLFILARFLNFYYKRKEKNPRI